MQRIYRFNNKDIIPANMVFAVLNAEIEQKVLDKSPLNHEAYVLITYCYEFGSKAYLTANQGNIFREPSEYELEVVEKVRQLCKDFGLVDITNSEAIISYYQDVISSQENVWDTGDTTYFQLEEDVPHWKVVILKCLKVKSLTEEIL